jgi:glycosyltransferase involved in cell wall biosynthesis
VLWVVSDVEHAVGFQWVAEHIDPDRFELSYVLMNAGGSSLERWLRSRGHRVWHVPYAGPRDLPAATIIVDRTLRAVRPDVVHCHLLGACAAALPLARVRRVPLRTYTRHWSTIHLQDRRLVSLLDRMINHLCTHVVAISENVREVLQMQEQVPEQKIRVVRHGFDLDRFACVDPVVTGRLRRLYGIPEDATVVGMIARHIECKGLQYAIPAFATLRRRRPDVVLVLANAHGDYHAQVLKMLRTLPSDSYRLIRFEPDVFGLWSLFDVHVHVPVDPVVEAFGQTYVETMAAGVPAVVTMSGIAHELVVHGRNAIVVPHRTVGPIVKALEQILDDRGLRDRLVSTAQADVRAGFGVQQMVSALEALYQEV